MSLIVKLADQDRRDVLPSLYNGLSNPPKFDNIDVFGILLANAIQLITTLCGVVAVIIVTWAGIQYITSQGDPRKVSEAKNTITYAVLGLILASGSYLIVEYLVRQFD
ncbi:hypothetical protein EPO04_03235 [Patescibacteria group bacterium]|nr:MAG: hypothetical protein EPO04_03235 [Patescibacteria group bacterium]